MSPEKADPIAMLLLFSLLSFSLALLIAAVYRLRTRRRPRLFHWEVETDHGVAASGKVRAINVFEAVDAARAESKIGEGRVLVFREGILRFQALVSPVEVESEI